MGKWEDIIQQKSLRAKPFQAKPDWDRMEAMLDQEDNVLVGAFWTQPRKWAAGITLTGLLILSMWLIADYMTASEAATSIAIEEVIVADPPLAHLPDLAEENDKDRVEPSTDQAQAAIQEGNSPSTSISSLPNRTDNNHATIDRSNLEVEPVRLPSPRPSLAATVSSSQQSAVNHTESAHESPIIAELEQADVKDLGIIAESMSPSELSLPLLTSALASKLPALDPVVLHQEESQKATVFKKASHRVLLALGPDVDKKWAQTPWAVKIYLTGSAFSPTIWIDSSILQPNIVMAGLGVELNRQLRPRWEVGGRLDLGSYNQIMLIEPRRSALPVSPSGQSYMAIQGTVQDFSGQAKYHFAKRRIAGFRPYLVAGIGLHVVQSNLYGVNNFSTPYLSNISLYRDYEANTNATAGYFSSLQTSLAALKTQEDTESSYEQIGQRHTFSRVMLYSGLGFDLRLHRRVSLTWEMTLHTNRAADPFFRNLSNSDFLEVSNPIDQDPTSSPTELNSIPPQVQENWTPGFMRQSIGLRIAL